MDIEITEENKSRGKGGYVSEKSREFIDTFRVGLRWVDSGNDGRRGSIQFYGKGLK